MKILVLNGGSSSFKCALFSGEELLWKESMDWSGGALKTALEPILQRAGEVDAVGHRVVHGGSAYRATTWLTDDVRAAIASQAETAPVHNRFELEAIDAVRTIRGPDMRQAAVFDTAFHATIEPAAYVYPGPYEWFTTGGIRRFGFHGISHQYSTRRAAELLGKPPGRLVVCHLGSGASLCAVRDGKSVDTTMGFTPLEGLMMATRSGSLDPGIIIYLLRHRGYTAEDLDRILNRESGLLGVSGVSSDMRKILEAAAQGNTRAQLAYDIYLHRLTRELGSMIATLGGVDALVLTGGVGENSAPVRGALCRQFAFLGWAIDPAKNASPQSDQDIAAAASSTPILVIRADEESEIARECRHLAGYL